MKLNIDFSSIDIFIEANLSKTVETVTKLASELVLLMLH